MKTSAEGKALIKKFEGCELESYLCPSKVWTVGFGTTKNVVEGMTITQDMAEEMLDKDLLEFEEYVDKLVEVPLDQSQYDALVAWTYNLGPTNLKSSTMLKVLNDGKYDEVPAQMRRWNKSNGEVLTGFVRRREAESLLFQGKEWHEV